MKTKLPTILLAGLLSIPAMAADQTELKDQKDKLSYSIGMSLGNNIKAQEVEVTLDVLFQGVRDALGGKTLLTDEQMRDVIREWQREYRAKQEEKRKELGEKNKAEGEKFLAENKSKPGVIALPSGLQYKVLQEGKGDSPGATDTVTVHYRGTLIDGTEFDSSYRRNAPASFGANRVIKGWTEALQLMKPGDKWQIFVPSELAYGANGKAPQISPNATLIFEVELLSFEHRQPAAAAKPVPPTPTQPVTSDIIKVPSKEELEKGAKIEIIKAEDLEKLQKEAQQQKEKKEDK